MATPTYVPLATITLASTDSEIVFSSIPATPYRDLIVVIVAKTSTGTRAAIEMYYNNTTGNQSRVYMYGDGSTTGSGTGTVQTVGTLPNSGEQFNQYSIQIFDYSATNKHKTALTGQSWAGVTVDRQAMRWAVTDAINSVKLTTGQPFAIGSTFSLYGVN